MQHESLVAKTKICFYVKFMEKKSIWKYKIETVPRMKVQNQNSVSMQIITFVNFD